MTRPGRRALSLLALTGALAACGGERAGDVRGAAPTAATRPAGRGASPDARPSALLRLVRVGGSFSSPLYVTAPPGDRRRIFVVQQTGQIKVVRDGRKLPGSFLDLSGQVSCCNERGLLSMAFAPDDAATGRFYVDYTDRTGNTRVVEYRRSTPDRANPASARLVLFQRQPESNHNGGLVLFGPIGCSTSAWETVEAPTTTTDRAATRRASPLCWARSCASTPVPASAAPTGSRPPIPSPAAAACAGRSTPTACATHGDSRSTA